MSVLEAVRTSNNLSKMEMAQRLKIGKSYYSMLSRGQRNITKSIALRLEDEFGVPLCISLRPEVHGMETLAFLTELEAG
ncbi:MAG: helix-turn-helix protein [Firmicutes bacterium]|nr:helix-turn-helix protein [Bacillota bacterium]